jgi:hypothetical protein
LTIEGALDLEAVKLTKRVLSQSSSAKIAGMIHHSDVLLSHPVPDFIPRERFTAIYLSQHTLLDSRKLINDPSAIFLYPIPPTTILKNQQQQQHFASPSSSLALPSSSSSSQHHHHHRLEPVPLSNPHHFPVFVVQGHFGGAHSWRRDHHSFLSCLREAQKQRNRTRTKVNFIGFGDLDFTSPEREALKVHHFSHLRTAKAFYHKISHGNYLALTHLDEEYYSKRATSSIPAALLTGLPLVFDRRMLDLYPCLRDSFHHKRVTKETFCESLETVMTLSPIQWQKLVMEVHQCRKLLSEDAQTKLELLLSDLSGESETSGIGPVRGNESLSR